MLMRTIIQTALELEKDLLFAMAMGIRGSMGHCEAAGRGLSGQESEKPYVGRCGTQRRVNKDCWGTCVHTSSVLQQQLWPSPVLSKDRRWVMITQVFCMSCIGKNLYLQNSVLAEMTAGYFNAQESAYRQLPNWAELISEDENTW